MMRFLEVLPWILLFAVLLPILYFRVHRKERSFREHGVSHMLRSKLEVPEKVRNAVCFTSLAVLIVSRYTVSEAYTWAMLAVLLAWFLV